jgi:hypothetical protein
MANKILFVFEGKKTEKLIVSNLQTFFVNENTIVKCVYGAEIYQIYKEIVADENLDTFNLIKERNIENKAILHSYTRDDFAEIYMFFDYDGHATLADDNKLKELLEFFKEETDKGKLYVSYPMAEALKHICDYETFKDLTVECKKNISYKNIVHDSCIKSLKSLIHCNSYNLETWKQLINVHLKKMNFVVNDSFTLPGDIISQFIIFSKQLEKYININSTVAVLSAFPVFLHDYYGNAEIKKRIE